MHLNYYSESLNLSLQLGQTISEKNQMDVIPQVKIGQVALHIFPACSMQLGSLTLPHRFPAPGILAHPGFVLYPKLQREGILGAIQKKWKILINSIFIPTD